MADIHSRPPLPHGDRQLSPEIALTDLQAGALGLGHVLMQSITYIAPTLGILFGLQFVVGQAGIAAPTLYIFAAAIMFMVALGMAELAKHMPSAGGWYTYVSRAVHPRAGFVVSWMYMLFAPPTAGVVLAFLGSLLQSELKVEYGFNFPWWCTVLLGGGLVTFIGYRGIKPSVRLLVAFGLLELAILLSLGIWCLASPGPGGVTLAAFNPGNAPSFTSVYLGVVLSIFVLTGWDGAAPLAEETTNPRGNIVKAVLGSLLIFAIIVVLMTWALETGWGVDHLSSLVSSSTLPAFVLAQKFWGHAWVLLLFALVNATLAVSLAANNISSHMWYAMGRSGSFPKWFEYIHPKYKTPVHALHLQTALTVAIGFGFALLIGPGKIWYFFGVMGTFCVAPVFILGNVGVFLFYYRTRRGDFNWLIHAVFPAVSSVAIVWLVYKSSVPLPAAPNNWAPVVAAVWFAACLVILVVMRASGREAWMIRAGDAAEVVAGDTYEHPFDPLVGGEAAAPSNMLSDR